MSYASINLTTIEEIVILPKKLPIAIPTKKCKLSFPNYQQKLHHPSKIGNRINSDYQNEIKFMLFRCNLHSIQKNQLVILTANSDLPTSSIPRIKNSL